MASLIGYLYVAGVLWMLLWRINLTRSDESSTSGTRCVEINNSLPFVAKVCISQYPETWDTAQKVCLYDFSYLLSLNVFNLNYTGIKPILGDVELLHMGMRRQNGIFNWVGLKPEMFHTSINGSDWGWQWHDDEPKQSHCVAINVTSGKLLTVNCIDKLLKFICARDNNTKIASKLCNEGWKYSSFSNVCLWKSSDQANYTAANMICRNKASHLLSNATYLDSFPALRFMYNRSWERSEVWLNTLSKDQYVHDYGKLITNRVGEIQKKNTNAQLGIICEQDPLAIDIKATLNHSNSPNSSFAQTTLICEVSINGTKEPIDNCVWWKNDEIIQGRGYSLVLGYNSGVERLSTEQGLYWCEVIIPGYPEHVLSAPEEFYHTDVSTMLMHIKGSLIPYDPIKYDRSRPYFEEEFVKIIIGNKFSALFKNFTQTFPYFPYPEWQLLNVSKTGNLITLKMNIFINHEGRDRPANESKDIFNPVGRYLFHHSQKEFSEWKLVMCDIKIVGICLTEHMRTTIGDVVWNQTYHSKFVTSVPMCLSVDWKILTRSCNGGFGSESKWSSFDQNQCVRFNKVLKNTDHHHCHHGYRSWNYTTCIRIYSNPANWSEAVAECGRSLGFLFTPRVVSRNFLLHDFNSSFKIFEDLGEIWLGGYRENGIIQWTAFEPGPVELNKSSFVEWKENYNKEYDCVSGIISNGKITVTTKPCEERKPYVCMHKNPEGKLFPTSRCKKNWYGSPWLDVCYLVNHNSLPWDKALDHCQDYKPDGTLVILTSPKENDLLKNHLLNNFRNTKNDTWWIGLQKNKNFFSWTSSDNYKLTYVDWYLDAEYNLSNSAVAFSKKAYEENIRWVELNQMTELPSICQAGITSEETWCRVSVIGNIYKCEFGHTIYQSVTWYKDGIAISGSRGLIETSAKEFNPIDLLNNSVLHLKEHYHLQGYYWCEVQQKDPFLSVASHNVLFVDKGYWTFVGRFIATKIKGHYNIGQEKFWNLIKEINESLNGEISDGYLVKDTYITDLSRVDTGNEVKLYIYSHPPKGKYNNFIEKKQRLEDIKQYIIQQLKKSGSKLVEKYGIIPEKISVMNTDVCFSDNMTGKLFWETTTAGRSASADCINENGQPVVRRCLGNFTHGVHWGSVDGSCSEKRSKFTLRLKELSKEKVNYSNLKNTSKTLKILTNNTDELIGMDIHYTATTLENIAHEERFSDMVVHDVVATVNNIMKVQQEIIDGAQIKTNASIRIVAAFEKVFKNSKRLLSITNSSIAARSIPLVDKDSMMTTGFVSMNRNADGYNVAPISNNDTIVSHNTLAGIWLPPELVEERAKFKEKNTYFNFILYANATLFVSLSGVQKTTAVISPVISAFFSNGPVHLSSQRILLAFKIWQVDKELPGTAKCVYWEQNMNENQGGWSTVGCSKPSVHSSLVLCHCDHLTSFAVLVDLYSDDNDNIEESADALALDIITYLGCTLSIFGLLLTITTLVLFRKLRNGVGSQVLCNLSVSLLLLLIVFMAGINQTHWKPGCMLVAALLHYLLLVAFSWMLVEAILQYLRLVKVIGTYIPRFVLKSAVCAWGIPLLIVILILTIDYELYHSKKNYCWIHIKAFYYGFLLPAALVMICNIVVFGLIIHSITRNRDPGLGLNQKERKLAITRLKAACCILFLLGLSWSFGFLAISSARLVFKYLFSIFTTLQGFFIFLFHVVQEKTTRNLWFNYIFRQNTHVQTFTTRDTSMFVKDSTNSRNR